ncbi:MAG: SAM-dependent chlorinase/fluorinase [Muricomes sp.]
MKKWIGIESVREIDESVNRLRGKGTEGVAIFHGRDLFGHTAARLASGIIDFEGVGPEYPVEEIVEHPILEPTVEPGKVQGIFEINDPNFGNLWTNIPLNQFKEAGFEYGDYINLVVKHDGENSI